MAYIELVIKIPKEDYTKISNSNPSYADDFALYYAIKNGIPIPKGYGDLKDIGNLKYVFDLTRTDYIYSGEDIRRAMESMVTIVPADKDETNDNR